MPKRNAVEKLPQDLREKVNQFLKDNSFSDYEKLTGFLQGLGYSISYDAVARYGKRYGDRIRALETTTEIAKSIAARDADGVDVRNTAIIGFAQTILLDTFTRLSSITEGDNPVECIGVLSEISKITANLSRASMSVARYQAEIKARMEKYFEELEGDGALAITPEALTRIKGSIYALL